MLRQLRTHASRTVARLVDLPLDPVGVARRLVHDGLPDVALLHAAAPTGRHGRFSALAVRATDRCEAPHPPEEAPCEGAFAAAPRWIGVIPYEARRELERTEGEDRRPAPLLTAPAWRRYAATLWFDHWKGRVFAVGDDPQGVAALVECASGPVPAARSIEGGVSCPEPAERHAARVAVAVERIAAGDFYQVNLARRLDVRVGSAPPIDVYARLAAAAPSPYGAALHFDDVAVVSCSPELLVEATTDARGITRLLSAPIKGTRPRGDDAPHDARLAAELDADPKERAELAMIVDVVRGDLGRVCRVGSVRLVRPPHLTRHRTIWHREAWLAGALRPGVGRSALVDAMVPSGSVTGAPKPKAMEAIAELETARRGLYTGAIGAVSRGGALTLSMAIRCLVLQGGSGHYWTGGGIVIASDPAREVEETRWKAAQLSALLDGALHVA